MKIWLKHGDKRVTKKKTTVKKATLQPYYDESFTFEVAIDDMKVSLHYMIYFD